MYKKEGAYNGLLIEADIIGDSSCDELVMNALKTTGRSYSPTVTWNEERKCYHLEAQWDVDPDWGDDFIAIERRLSTVVPRELISICLDRPNEPIFEEGMFFDLER